MSKPENSSLFCLFCYKSINYSNENSEFAENVNRFVKLLNRFAGQDTYSFFDHFDNEKFLGCCHKCEDGMDVFCEIYQQFEVLKLKLDYMLDKMVEKINYANKVPARWIHVNKVLEESFPNDLGKKVESQKRIRKLRQNVIEAGKH